MKKKLEAGLSLLAGEWFLIGTVTTLVLLFILFRMA
jgi:hypothetical protein